MQGFLNTKNYLLHSWAINFSIILSVLNLSYLDVSGKIGMIMSSNNLRKPQGKFIIKISSNSLHGDTIREKKCLFQIPFLYDGNQFSKTHFWFFKRERSQRNNTLPKKLQRLFKNRFIRDWIKKGYVTSA